MERKYIDDKSYIDDCLTIEIEEGPAEKCFFEEGNYKFKFEDIDSFYNGNDWFKPDKDYFEMNVELVSKGDPRFLGYHHQDPEEETGEPYDIYKITVEVQGTIYHDDPKEKPEPYTFRYERKYCDTVNYWDIGPVQ